MKPVFRYDKHMPETDDVTLIVLKGHLLVEEMLVQLAETVFPHPQYLTDANLMFYKLVCVVRATLLERSDDAAWQLILSLNSLRNDLAHNLESSKRQDRLNALFTIAAQVQPSPGMLYDRSGDVSLEESERLRRAVVDCMEFLISLTSHYEKTSNHPSKVLG